MFRKSTKPKGLRRRERGQDDDDEESPGAGSGEEDGAGTQDVLNKQKLKTSRKADGVLGFSTGAVKKQKQEEAAATRFAYESAREVQVQTDNRATATLETETEFDRDSRAIRERVLQRAAAAVSSAKEGEVVTDDKVYRGAAGYKDHTAGFRREHTVSGEKAGGAHGPLRASAHVRMSVRFDYQPDICKDYKETGYCGYGDSCKFMHDRGDYKSGWQLEREWDEKEKRRKAALAMGGGEGEGEEEGAEGKESDEEEEDALPFACFICRSPFEDPVVTRCKHYFCEHCALKHNAKNKNCYVCNKPTQGVFNTAHEILRKQKEAKASSTS